METDTVRFARDQTADRLADRFEDTSVTVETRSNYSDSVFLSQESNSNVLQIEDELDDLGCGVTIKKRLISSQHDSGPTFQLRLDVDTGVVGLEQAVAHLEDTVNVVDTETGDDDVAIMVDSSVDQDAFLNAVTTAQSNYHVRVDTIMGWDADAIFTVYFKPAQ